MTTLKSILEDRVTRYDSIKYPAYLERFVLAQGREYSVIADHMPYPRGEAKMCYMNAFNLAMKHRDLTYVEGYAMKRKLGIEVLHAWCVNKKDQIIDVTWEDPEDCLYYGVPFSRIDMLEWTLRREVYGILSDDMINMDIIEERMPELVRRSP